MALWVYMVILNEGGSIMRLRTVLIKNDRLISLNHFPNINLNKEDIKGMKIIEANIHPDGGIEVELDKRDVVIEEKLLDEFKSLCKSFYVINKGEFQCPYYYRLQGARCMLDALGIKYNHIENLYKNMLEYVNSVVNG